MNKNILIAAQFVFFVFLTATSFAHHAKEYLRTESYAQAAKGRIILFNGFDNYKPSLDNSEFNEWEYTPTFIYGISNRLMLNVHTHLLKIKNASAFFEAGAFGLQYQRTKPEMWLIDVGLNVEYKIQFHKSRDLIDGKQILASSLILGKELQHDINITSNISHSNEVKYGHNKDELNITLAAKGHIIHQYNWLESGLEFLYTIDENPSVVMAPGIYMSLSDAIV